MSTNVASERLQIDTDLLLIITSTCWRAFRGYQHRWPWTTLNHNNIGF